jgi:hypothetical protein
MKAKLVGKMFQKIDETCWSNVLIGRNKKEEAAFGR